MISLLLFKLSAFCRCRIINGPDEKPYLERYHLLRLPFGYRVYLHRFVASDPGRGLHNHPWNHAISWVISGSYEEIRMRGPREDHRLQSRRLGAGSFNLKAHDPFFRIRQRWHEIRPADGTAVGLARHIARVIIHHEPVK